jgi:glycosyltransferase involved in cell wall biosynthesis
VRILHVTPLYAPAWHFGGVVRSVSTLAEECAARGVEVAVITTGIGTPHEKKRATQHEVRRGVRVAYCSAFSTPIGLMSSEMTKSVEDALRHTDVCHITGVWQPSVLAAARLCHQMGVPYVTSPRGALSPYSFRDGRLKKAAYYTCFERSLQRQAAAIHATSPLEERELCSLLPDANVAVIGNICESSHWLPEPERGRQWRNEHGIATDTPLFLHVGRIEPKKNLPFLGEVARSLPRDSPWQFVLVGPAEPAELARVRASFRHDPRRLTVISGTGSDDVLRAIYSAATCFVMPSFHENFANVIVEAVFCGARVLASRYVGVAEMLPASPRVRMLPLDRNVWASVLSDICDAGRPLLSADPPSGALNSFSAEIVIQQMIQLYSHSLRACREVL